MGNGVTFREIAKILFWQKRLAVVAFLAIFVPVAIKTLTDPDVYTSSTKLLYRTTGPNLTFTTGLVRVGPREELNTEIELIHSYPVMSKVLHRLVAWRKARAELVGKKEKKREEVPVPGTAGWNKAVKELSKSVETKPVEGANVIRVSYTCEDPDEAALVARAVAEEYVKYHVQVRRSGQAEAFFAERIQDTRARLDSLEETLAAVKRRHGIVSYDQQERMALDRLSVFDQRLNELRTQILSHELRLKRLKEALRGPELTLPEREVADYPLVMQLRQRLSELELERADLAKRFRSGYSGLRLVEQRIEETKKQLRKQLEQLAEIEEGSLASLRAEEAAIQSTLSYLRGEIESFPEKERAISELQLAIEETRRIYSLLLQRYEEARINEASDPRVASVVIVDPARVPAEPSGPRRARNLALGLMFAAVGAVGIALLAHRMDPTVKSPDDLQQMGVAKVVSVPYAGKKR